MKENQLYCFVKNPAGVSPIADCGGKPHRGNKGMELNLFFFCNYYNQTKMVLGQVLMFIKKHRVFPIMKIRGENPTQGFKNPVGFSKPPKGFQKKKTRLFLVLTIFFTMMSLVFYDSF